MFLFKNLSFLYIYVYNLLIHYPYLIVPNCQVPNYAAHAKTEGITCNGEEMECVDYVYDVYYMNDTDVNINNMQQISSVMPIYENDC